MYDCIGGAVTDCRKITMWLGPISAHQTVFILFFNEQNKGSGFDWFIWNTINLAHLFSLFFFYLEKHGDGKHGAWLKFVGISNQWAMTGGITDYFHVMWMWTIRCLYEICINMRSQKTYCYINEERMRLRLFQCNIYIYICKQRGFLYVSKIINLWSISN